ncbi:uncharacterized protein LOC119990471 isoform X2 [Tripterygium wilfordii]|uniref:uncharacterized protein LOC119990471 isoform X2 n=1 Tax=Tripterygium wilfordii TaxID=458696 RepID=UPI0018F84673|nr:uncharacterized protein LOC119990471 isoform X2 [Tripterygium wilfordii]XP_038692332.1 uncharacterized protein LOC119990471 isoform X2 [Tripterygium wilfordii]
MYTHTCKKSKVKVVEYFDMVTCTVTMPTDMVECIRRSLELGIVGCNSYQYGRTKWRQRSTVTSSARYCDSFSDDSDDADSNITIQSDSSSTHGYHYSLSQMNYDLESSPEISSATRDCGLRQNPIIQFEQKKHKYAQYQFESMGSLCSELVECDNQLDSVSSPSSTVSLIHLNNKFSLPKNGTVKYTLENDSLDFSCASDVEDFMDHSLPERSYMADQLEISEVICHGIDISNPSLFDGESISESYTPTGSDRSNAFGNGFENEHSDVNDVELSSTSSMNSVSGALLKLNFDDQVDEEDGFKTLQLPESRNQVVVFPTKIPQLCSHYRSCGNNSRSYDSRIWMPQADLEAVFGGGIINKFEMNASEPVRCNQCQERLSVHSNSPYDYHQLDQGGKCAIATNRDGCHVSSSVCTLPSGFPDEGLHRGAALKYVVTNPHPTSHNGVQVEERIDYPETRSIATGRVIPHKVPKVNTDVHSSSLSPHLSEPMPVIHPCITTKCSEDMRENGHLVYSDEEEDLYTAETVDKRHSQGDRKNENKRVDHKVEQAKHNPKRWSVLKPVVGGTAVVGMVFLLLRYRKSGRDKKGDNSMQSNQMQRTNCGSFSSQKEQKGGQVNGVYPAEKLKL